LSQKPEATPSPFTTIPTLLVVDEEVAVRRSLNRVLSRQGYNVVDTGSADEGLAIAQRHAVDLALVDVNIEDMPGTELIRQMRAACPQTEVIAITRHGAADLAFNVLREGACDYFEKPISDWQRFYQVIRKNLEIREKSREIVELRARCDRLQELRQEAEFGQLIGNSPAMRELQTTIAQVGPHNVSVLVVGESGSGKERVARALHASSKNKNGPFVAINCAGLQMELLESELFGYERGAHSMADRHKQGLFEVADNGTVFLDEIGEMPYEMQAKLLRVLNEREFRRVGGTRDIPLRARIISATNRDLRADIRDKKFREDLYYRLNVFEIRVPPLRDRKEDIPLLAYYFTQKYNAEYGMNVKRLTPDALALFNGYSWSRNNVRELERAIQRAVVLSNGSQELDTALFPITSSDTEAVSAPVGGLHNDDGELLEVLVEGAEGLSYKDAKEHILTTFSQRYIRQRLQESNHNITRAAELSGMLRPNFAKLMKRYDISLAELKTLLLKG
jgi:DNA-binding NtrC family response regulator